MVYGCSIRVNQNVTKGNICALCQDLALCFGAGYVFSPLDRVEGGVAWEMWPGKEDGQLKSLRFCVNGSDQKEWPYAGGGSSWQNSEDVAIQCNTDTIHGHHLKCSHVSICSYDLNAAWTQKEWNIFKLCLKKYLG